MAEVADFLVGEVAPVGPGEDVVALERDGFLGAGVLPWADGGSVQRRKMGAAAEFLAEVAGEGADVVAAADGDS